LASGVVLARLSPLLDLSILLVELTMQLRWRRLFFHCVERQHSFHHVWILFGNGFQYHRAIVHQKVHHKCAAHAVLLYGSAGCSPLGYGRMRLTTKSHHSLHGLHFDDACALHELQEQKLQESWQKGVIQQRPIRRECAGPFVSFDRGLPASDHCLTVFCSV